MNGSHHRVLLIADSPADADRVRLELKKTHRHYEVECAKRLKAAIQLLEERQFDIILSDLTLPDANGLDIVARFRLIHHATPLTWFLQRPRTQQPLLLRNESE